MSCISYPIYPSKCAVNIDFSNTKTGQCLPCILVGTPEGQKKELWWIQPILKTLLVQLPVEPHIIKASSQAKKPEYKRGRIDAQFTG